MKKNLFATTKKQHTVLELIEAFLEDKKIAGKAEKTVLYYSGALKTVGLVNDEFGKKLCQIESMIDE